MLVTGSAGFIGSNLVMELFRKNSPIHVIGIDNMNDYYDVSIKNWRLQQIEAEAVKHQDSSWTFIRGNIADKRVIDDIFSKYKPAVVVNLAAKPEFAIQLQIPMRILKATLLGSIIFLKPVVIAMSNMRVG